MIRRPDHRSAAPALAARLIVGCLLALLGCAGGSGSSGFDLAENGAIMQALDEERCVESDGLTICPANGAEASATPTTTATPVVEPTSETPTSPPTFETPTATSTGDLTPTPTFDIPSETMTPSENSETRTPTPTGPTDEGSVTPTPSLPRPTVASTATRTAIRTPTPTPTIAGPAEMRIDTSFGENRAVDCVGGGDACSFSFAFAPQGFAPETTFQVAARLREPDGEWLVFPAEEVSFDPTMPVFEALITLKLEGRGGEGIAQVAVLVFDTPSAAPGPAVDSLGASGANFAFVTSELTVILDP